MKQVLILLAIILTTPAHAFPFNESAESYYARQMKSCEIHEPRTSVWDYFAGTRIHRFDECCVGSVKTMQKAGARRVAADGACPQGQLKKSDPCATSKHWCEGGK